MDKNLYADVQVFAVPKSSTDAYVHTLRELYKLVASEEIVLISTQNLFTIKSSRYPQMTTLKSAFSDTPEFPQARDVLNTFDGIVNKLKYIEVETGVLPDKLSKFNCRPSLYIDCQQTPEFASSNKLLLCLVVLFRQLSQTIQTDPPLMLTGTQYEDPTNSSGPTIKGELLCDSGEKIDNIDGSVNIISSIYNHPTFADPLEIWEKDRDTNTYLNALSNVSLIRHSKNTINRIPKNQQESVLKKLSTINNGQQPSGTKSVVGLHQWKEAKYSTGSSGSNPDGRLYFRTQTSGCYIVLVSTKTHQDRDIEILSNIVAPN